MVSQRNQGFCCASGALEVADCPHLRYDGLAIGCECGGGVGDVGAGVLEANFRSRRQRPPSRCPISNVAFAFLTEEDGSDVFGEAAVDVLGNKVQGRVVMGQHVLMEDLQQFDTLSWLTTKDQSDLHTADR